MAVSLTISESLRHDVSRIHVPSWTLGRAQLERGRGNYIIVIHVTVT